MTNDNTPTTGKTIQKKTICDNLQAVASSWEQILHTSGGSLELSKYACYLITWGIHIQWNPIHKQQDKHQYN